jgi:hypothetical protein
MNTTPEQREYLMDALMERGELPDSQTIVELIQDAEEGEQYDAALQSVEKAVSVAGMVLVDTTTDDDEACSYILMESMEDG